MVVMMMMMRNNEKKEGAVVVAARALGSMGLAFRSPGACLVHVHTPYLCPPPNTRARSTFATPM